jgi:hypothetical protein
MKKVAELGKQIRSQLTKILDGYLTIKRAHP